MPTENPIIKTVKIIGGGLLALAFIHWIDTSRSFGSPVEFVFDTKPIDDNAEEDEE